MNLNSVIEALRSRSSDEKGHHLSGAENSARAYLTAGMLEALFGPLVLICPDDEVAASLAMDLETFRRQQNAKWEILTLPSYEQSPYSTVSPSVRTRNERISTLIKIHLRNTMKADETASPTVLVTSLMAAAQQTLPPSVLEAHRIRLEMGRSVGSRESLIERLSAAGYLRVDPVEDPGTFAVRGEIIDVFPPDQDAPVRLEFFDDEIEKIRHFDPKSQLTGGEAPLSFIELFPARETLVNRDSRERLREKLKAHCDEFGIGRKTRDPVIESVLEGYYPDHSEFWAPFAYEAQSNLLDYLETGNWKLIWVDALSIQQNQDVFMQEQKSLFSETPQNAVIAPPPEELFRWGSESEKRADRLTLCFFDSVRLANMEGRHHVLSTRSNADLSSASPKMSSSQALASARSRISSWLEEGWKVTVVASTGARLERMKYLLGQNEPMPEFLEGVLSSGFRWPDEKVAFVTEEELLGTEAAGKKERRRSTRSDASTSAQQWAGLKDLSDLSPGDAVVHIDHGIGKYQGLTRIKHGNMEADFLLLEYLGQDKLYLPVYRLNVIQKYIGAGESVQLDRLGTQNFQKTKERVKGEVRKLAINLIELYAQRSLQTGLALPPPDEDYRAFEARFPFDETPDQLKAIEDVLGDLESGRPMDRLICGDVGYGKTEVAIRAAYRLVSEGYQVAVLVPTTVLAQQHEQSFRMRMKDLPVRIESISRFKSSREQKEILEQVKEGRVDILIGTHRMLSKDVRFRNLGLLVVDEEQRFGVAHKEKLKTFKINTHVLTLTATPIPRTLQMSLSGLRDISIIYTPPVNRLPIRTFISRYDDHLVARSVRHELSRGGQVFFVHNRVQSIYSVAKSLGELIPEAKIAVAHGQMKDSELEKVMTDFYGKASNVLVCTAIIESGLDVPSANTLVVDRADRFGLAQLYQIRGRVGRSQERAYAYLLLPQEGYVTDDAKKRLEVIQRFVELGSGFQVASHDLEIRGGGDLLGAQQSGHVAAVGFDLYTELLEEAIQELQGKEASSAQRSPEPEIKTPHPAYLSESYIPDVHQRLSMYRRFSAAENEEELSVIERELQDRYGPLPDQAKNLGWVIRIKILLKEYWIDSLTAGPTRASLGMKLAGAGRRLDPAKAISLVATESDSYQLLPDERFVAKVNGSELKDLYLSLESLLTRLSFRA